MSKLTTLWPATLAALAFAVACGGASESNPTWSDGGAASGNAGAPARGGTDDTENAGAPDHAAGAASDSTAGGAPSGSSGAPSAGGNDSSEGGDPSAPPTPDPTVREGCTAWCEGVDMADCNGTPQAECLLGCRALASSPTCSAQYKALFECSAGRMFTCNQEGDAVPQGCELSYAQAALCVLSHPDDSLAEPCQAYCDRAAAAACPNSPAAGECAYGCQVASSVVPACADDWRTFVKCAASADVTCNDSGDPSPNSCAASYLRYAACIVEAGR